MAWNPFKRQPEPTPAPRSTSDVPVINAVFDDDPTWRPLSVKPADRDEPSAEAPGPLATPDVDDAMRDDELVEQPAVVGTGGSVALPDQVLDERGPDGVEAAPEIVVVDATQLDVPEGQLDVRDDQADVSEVATDVSEVPADAREAQADETVEDAAPALAVARPHRFSAATVIAAAELLHGTHDAVEEGGAMDAPAAGEIDGGASDAAPSQDAASQDAGASRAPLVEPLTPTFTAAAVATAASRLHGGPADSDGDATQAMAPIGGEEPALADRDAGVRDATDHELDARDTADRGVESDPTDAVPASITPVPMPAMSDEERAERERLERERAARREARRAALAAPVEAEPAASEPKVVEVVREVHPKRVTDRFAGSLGLFLLRAATAAILLAHGLNGWLNNALMQQTWSNTVLPSPGLIARGLPILEALLALLIFFGLLTRLAGLLVAGIGVVTLAFVMWGRWSIFTPGSLGFLGEQEVLLTAVGLALALLGAGGWSIDYLARKESQRVE